MVHILFFLLILFQAASSLASGSLTLPQSPIMESSPKSKEIKKIAKQLEDPEERQKLLKTLKVLAAAQEAEEKKKGRALVSYITPIIQFGMDSALAFFNNVKKIPVVAKDYIDYLKVEENRKDFWTALLIWFPLLILLEAFFERVHLWFLRRSFEVKKPAEGTTKLANSKAYYAYWKLFLSFLLPIIFLPFYVANPSVRNWIIGFWVVLFVGRLILLEKRVLPAFAIATKEKHTLLINVGMGIVLGIVTFLAVIMMYLMDLSFQKNRKFLFTPILLIYFPYLVLFFREWKSKIMQRCLDESRSLSTVPKKSVFLINICIRYIPTLILVLYIPLVIEWIFSEGSLFDAYGSQSIVILAMLSLFLWGRRRIEALAHYKMPEFLAVKMQAFTSYGASMGFTFAKGLQWIWHIFFFAALIAIWNHCFSDSFINIVSHPMTKTMTTIALIWVTIYLAWLGLDFFVQFHTKPQIIKGKRKEPTVFAKTFGPMLHSVARWVMVLVTIFITLESLGFDLKILVYLMSAFAFAISLGSQSLVKDVINGFFALIDGSFSVGDVVTVGAHTGAVESLSLRAITLRHGDGSLQTIPFSEVGNIINRSRDYTVVPIDIATSYKTKIGSVYEALTNAAEEMAKDPIFGKMILTPLSISGVDRFAENAVHVSASIKITPDPNKYFAREFNRRLKVHMDALGIAPPIAFQEEWDQKK